MKKTELYCTHADPQHERVVWDALNQITDPYIREEYKVYTGPKSVVPWLDSEELRGQFKKILAINMANVCTALPDKPPIMGRYYVEVQVLYRDADNLANDCQYYVQSWYFPFKHQVQKSPEEITPFDLVNPFCECSYALRRKTWLFLHHAGVTELRCHGEWVVVAHGSLSEV